MTTYTINFVEMTDTGEAIVHAYEVEATCIEEANTSIDAIQSELETANPDKTFIYDSTR